MVGRHRSAHWTHLTKLTRTMLPLQAASHTMRPASCHLYLAAVSVPLPNSVMTRTGKNIAVLGSTGSIGRNALEVIANSGGALCVGALSAHNNVDLLREQAVRFRPRWIILTDPTKAGLIDRSDLPEGVELLIGAEGITRAVGAAEIDMVLSAIVGSAGLQGTWDALEAGKPVALANKESLVVAGPLVMRLAAEKHAQIVPVDSEHSAVFQAMQSGRPSEVHRIILTASGGPFRTRHGPRACPSVGRRGPGPPHLGYGAENYD